MLFRSIGDVISKHVKTNKFTSSQFQEIIDEKSKMSGKSVSSALNKINFKKLTNLSSGNIGWFNMLWLSSLKNNNNYLELNPLYNLKFPNSCTDNELLVLLQFYWHKRISIDNISSYFPHFELNKINEVLSYFKAEKLLIAKGRTMELNFHITPYLKKYFELNNYI